MVWRRVLVPNTCTLRELHGVIQVGMGWESARPAREETAIMARLAHTGQVVGSPPALEPGDDAQGIIHPEGRTFARRGGIVACVSSSNSRANRNS